PGLAGSARPGVEARVHWRLAQRRLEEVVRGGREARVVAVAQEQRAGRGTREAPGLLEDALEECPEVPLARERDPDLEELFKEPGSVEHDCHANGAATRFRPRRFAS